MNTRIAVALLAPTLSAAVLTTAPGCHTTTPNPYAGQPDPVPAPYNNPHIALSQPELVGSLGFDSPIVTRPDDLLTVGVPTRSLGENRYLLEYRFVWYDKSGLEVRPAMGWKEFVLEPKGSKVIQANALDKTAVDWKVEIRWANR